MEREKFLVLLDPKIKEQLLGLVAPTQKNWQTTLGMWALRAVSMGLIKKGRRTTFHT